MQIIPQLTRLLPLCLYNRVFARTCCPDAFSHKSSSRLNPWPDASGLLARPWRRGGIHLVVEAVTAALARCNLPMREDGLVAPK